MNVKFTRAPEEKKEAILKASVNFVAEDGKTASTKKIALAAGVSEGTIFNYFKNKDDLLNALFLHIKTTCVAYIKKQLYLKGRNPENTAGQWDLYLAWGISSPLSVRALSRLELTGSITQETRKKALSLFQKSNDFKALFWETMLCNISNQAILEIHNEALPIPLNDKENLKDTVLSICKILEMTKMSHFLTPLQDKAPNKMIVALREAVNA